MINDLNRTVLLGYLGADAKQQSANAPVTLSIATADKWADDDNNRQQRTDWHSVAVFGTLRNYAVKLKKGDRVYVEGKLRNNHYEKEVGGETVTIYNSEVLATNIERVAAKSDDTEE
jgi:single-strand DNA-binding protein